MSEGSTRRAKTSLARLANRQFGRVSRAQLRQFGSDATIATWLADGYLHRVLPHVYAVGHQARTVEADLAAALLYASPGAALSHASAAWWLGLIEDQPRHIHLTTPRRCRSLRGICVYGRRTRTRILHRGLTTTTVAQTLVDLAATAPLRTLRKALANAEYKKVLDVPAVEAAIQASRKGTKVRELRQATALP